MSGSEGSTVFFEFAYVMPEYINDFIKTNNYIRATVGFDYQFSNELYLSSEYQYCSAGNTKSYNLLNMITPNTSTAYTEGGVYLFNRHYLSILLSYPLTPLLSLSFNSLINITEIAFYNSFKIEYNIKENLYLDLGLFIPYSKNTSEFSYYPSILYLSVRLYQ